MQTIARHAAKYFDVEIVREVEFAPLDVVRIEHDGVRTVIAHAYSEERARELANELWLEGMGRTAETVTAPAIIEPVAEGMYLKDGVVYKVQRAIHGSGHLYAKELTAEGFVFAKGMTRNLNSSHRMTLEQAKEYGALYGVCCRCAAPLTDEKSIAAGIGPVCAGRF